jgi:signal transduction histidine kinase/CheY-like chemotaxis protein
LVIVALTTLVCWAMLGRFDNSNLIMVYLLGVCFAAVRLGRGPSALAGCLSVAAFDFCFVPPYLTFAVSDTQYLLTFAVMLVVGFLISTLAVRVRDQAEAARRREQRTQLLYSVSRELAGLRMPDEIAKITARHVGTAVRGPAGLLLPGPGGALIASPPEVRSMAAEPREVSVAQWVFEHGQMAGQGTDTLPGSAALYVPLRSGDRALGVLALRPDAGLLPLSPDQLDLVETLARQAAASLDRARLAAEGEEARVTAERERMRSTLLSSVSHDLRTPLAAITGAASSLLQTPPPEEPERRELAATINEEAERLNRLVANLLDMTRLESGTVPIRREWHSVEEVVGSALGRFEEALAGRRVETVMPADLPLVPMDAVLVEQVLVNLLRTRSVHTEPASALRVAAWREGGGVGIEVADEGPGLNAGDEERVFEKFFRGSSGAARGSDSASPSAGRSSPRTAAGSGPRTARPRCRLPVHASHRGDAAAPSRLGARLLSAKPPDEGAERGSPAPLVLVVDDEPQVVRFLRATLPAQGYRVVEAGTGEQGIVEASTRAPDLILLDLGLPDLDGVEVTRRLRGWSATPIIVLSARGQETDKIEALDAGADDYLTKPFGTGGLLARDARGPAQRSAGGGRGGPGLHDGRPQGRPRGSPRLRRGNRGSPHPHRVQPPGLAREARGQGADPSPAPEGGLGAGLGGGEPLPPRLHGPAPAQAGARPRAAALPHDRDRRRLPVEGGVAAPDVSC